MAETGTYGCVNCGEKDCQGRERGKTCDRWRPVTVSKMRKQVWIHCQNNCFEAMKISEEITDDSVFIDVGTWMCTKCGNICVLELVDLEKKDKATKAKQAMAEIKPQFHVTDASPAKPYIPPPLRDAKETETRGEQHERRKRESEKREVPEEKADVVGVLCLAGLELIVRDLAGRVEKLEHPMEEVSKVMKCAGLCMNYPEGCILHMGDKCTNFETKPDTVKQETSGIMRTVSNPLCQTCRNFCKLNKYECTEYQAKPDEELCAECTRTCKGAKVCQGFIVNPSVDEVKQEENRICRFCIKDGAPCTLHHRGKGCHEWETRIPPEESEDTVMDFSEALKLLKMGSKVRRVGWGKNHIVLQNRESSPALQYLYYVSEVSPTSDKFDAGPWAITDTDILATDWILHFD